MCEPSAHTTQRTAPRHVDAVAVSSILHYELANRDLDVESKEGNKGFLKHIKDNDLKQIRKGISSTTVIDLKDYLAKNSVNLRIK